VADFDIFDHMLTTPEEAMEAMSSLQSIFGGQEEA
jgi:hypothetical protein